MTPERKQWFGLRAVKWAMDDAPGVPPNLVPTLIGLARHAQDDGTGACPGVETLMGYTRKSRRQVKYDLDSLRDLKLIKVSDDQRRASHIRADRRPTVYDLAIPKPGTMGNPLHPVDPEPGATDCTPPTERGATERQTGCNTASNGVQWVAPEENYEKNKENKISLSGDRPTVPAPREPAAEDRERDDEDASLSKPEPLSVAQQTLADESVDLAEANLLIPVIEATNKVRSPAFWRHVAKNRDIVQILADARALLTDDNCPRCKGTAEIDDFSDYGGHPIKRTCPECSDPDNPPARCPDHPSYPTRTCGACRADRLAKGLERPRDQQPRSGERGSYQAQKVNGAPGSRTAGWDARRRQHYDDVPPGYHRRADGSLVLVNSRDPGIDWEADLFKRPETA